MIVTCHFQSRNSAATHSLDFVLYGPSADGNGMEQHKQVTDVLAPFVHKGLCLIWSI
jgi:hypothetical protein